ncbi:uncharacterized protein LOC129572258 [Sitodiplosis mosellana]|uniref:uncharacterized protein LOC129572258 n=1 Tax=Sitodiplosis mosellana TaxID=263140 RepID=UPI00244536C6|nr:uncharacterized protein LOC129572258 [Sitodiplosis mosellana]
MPRHYVDNAMNRSLGRVGMAHGTAVHSSSGNSNYSSSSSSRVYVDNAMNQSLGRVGLPLGSAIHSKSSQSSYSSPSTYVNNELNRRLGRVGLERGTAPHSKSEKTFSNTARTYVDNAYNRRLGRVGKPLGSAIDSKSKTSAVSKVGNAVTKTYVDNALNRRLGRVGKPLGSMPVSKVKCNPNVFDLNVNICPYQDKDMKEIYETLQDDVLEEIENLRNLQQARRDAIAKKDNKVELKPEQNIPFDDLELGEKIGGGGFGDVHIAFWKGQQVAVKKLRVQRVTQTRKKQFDDEVRGISGLEHPNIVKFYGACMVTPNLALVMEFLPDGSLYDNLYYSEVHQFDEITKNQLICDSFTALQYIHSKNMVHRDIKSKNIMLFDDKSRCKLADFGLALKDEMETNASTKDFGFVGTEKYCPKEVIEGERLTIEELKLVDVYSLALTSVELLTEKEPFNDCKNIHQIRKAISAGEMPTMKEIEISTDKKRLLTTALSKYAIERPSAALFLKSFKQIIAKEN